MKDQENLIQRQDTQIIELNTRIKQLEMEKNELLKQQSEEQPDVTIAINTFLIKHSRSANSRRCYTSAIDQPC